MWGTSYDRFVKVNGQWVKGSAVARIYPDRSGVKSVKCIVELTNGATIPTSQSMQEVLDLLIKDAES